MRTKSRPVRHGCVALALLMLLSVLLSVPSFAYEKINTRHLSSMTLVDVCDEVPLAGVTFRVYYVASVTANATFLADDQFVMADVALSTYQVSDGEWANRAATLESYVVSREADNDPIPCLTGTTDENGELFFSGIPTGLYLLLGEPITIGDTTYTPSPALVSVPGEVNQKEREYNYDPEFYIKNATKTREAPPPDTPTPDPTPETIDLTVLKIWKDEGHKEQRPSSVTVTLYRNNTVYDTVTLSSKNNWRHTWSGLSDSARWYLVENDVPEGYTVTAVRDGKVFTVTNTYTEPEEPGEPKEPDEPDKPAPPEQPQGFEEKLPQTGQLWWPVPLMAVGGLVLVLGGVGLKKKREGRRDA
jgi:LPXTG-motif cell wall-anchored protein